MKFQEHKARSNYAGANKQHCGSEDHGVCGLWDRSGNTIYHDTACFEYERYVEKQNLAMASGLHGQMPDAKSIVCSINPGGGAKEFVLRLEAIYGIAALEIPNNPALKNECLMICVAGNDLQYYEGKDQKPRVRIRSRRRSVSMILIRSRKALVHITLSSTSTL